MDKNHLIWYKSYFQIDGYHLVKYIFFFFFFLTSPLSQTKSLNLYNVKNSDVDNVCVELWDCHTSFQPSQTLVNEVTSNRAYMFMIILYQNIRIKFDRQGHCDKAKVIGIK